MVDKDIAIEWRRRALRQLLDFPDKYGIHIHEKVGELEEFPDCDNLKKLMDLTSDYRLAVNQHSVLFSFSNQITIISIDEVKHRDDSIN
jgi:mRNA interferase RelE/StbE